MSEFVCPHCGGKIGILKIVDSSEPAPTTDFSTLPWKKFPDGKGEWVFGGDPAAARLVEMLEKSPNRELTNGVHRFKLSVGKDGKTAFIHRFPLEAKK